MLSMSPCTPPRIPRPTSTLCGSKRLRDGATGAEDSVFRTPPVARGGGLFPPSAPVKDAAERPQRCLFSPLPKGSPCGGKDIVSSAPYAVLAAAAPTAAVGYSTFFSGDQKVEIFVTNVIRHRGKLRSDYHYRVDGRAALSTGFGEDHLELKLTEAMHKKVSEHLAEKCAADASIPAFELDVKTGKVGDPDLANVDHIVPRSKSGVGGYNNAAVCSARYNQREKKDDMKRGLFHCYRDDGGPTRPIPPIPLFSDCGDGGVLTPSLLPILPSTAGSAAGGVPAVGAPAGTDSDD